jgi:hypothetical protein
LSHNLTGPEPAAPGRQPFYAPRPLS